MSELRYLGVSVTHPSGRERSQFPAAGSTVTLRLATPNGRVRDVALTRKQLVTLIAEAAKALTILEASA